MRRNKVRPFDDSGERPINAFAPENNSSRWREGNVSHPTDTTTSIATSTAPQPGLKHTFATGYHSQLSSKSDKLLSLEEYELENSEDIVPRERLASSQSSKLERLVAVDRQTREEHAGAVGPPVNSDSTQPFTTTEVMTEQYSSEAESNVSTGEQDLLKYFTELNNSENSEIDVDMATRILLEGADINARGHEGQTCMHLAATYWQKEVVQFLVEKGANLHELDDFGATALHKAARVDSEEVVSYLIENNANVSHITFDTLQTPLHFAVLGNAINTIYVRKCIYVTGFAKRVLIHASNFSTLRLCNLACVGPTALKFRSRTVLSLYL